MNNLLERLHASFFFFLLVGPGTFMKIGSYLPSVILVGTAMLFSGLGEWVNAGWTLAALPSEGDEKSEKAYPHTLGATWVQRPRPVLQAVSIMAATHLLGVLLFYVVSSGVVSYFCIPILVITHHSTQIHSTVVFLVFAVLPAVALRSVPRPAPPSAPLATVLKAFNLCFTSAVISITSVVNFSLAAALAVSMGLPLTVASPSLSLPKRVAKYAIYSLFALGWLVLSPEETRKAIWNWEVLGVWLAPFVCIVYAPLVLQAALVCFLPLY